MVGPVDCAAGVKYLRSYHTGACQTIEYGGMFALGSTFEAENIYFYSSPGVCTIQPVKNFGKVTLYSTGKEIKPSEFVAATLETE